MSTVSQVPDSKGHDGDCSKHGGSADRKRDQTDTWDHGTNLLSKRLKTNAETETGRIGRMDVTLKNDVDGRKSGKQDGLQDPASKKVYVGNLHPRVSKLHLEKLMLPYGDIVDVTLCYHKGGRPLGFGFCEFARAEHGAAAIKALHGRPLLGRNLVVQNAKQQTDARNKSSASSGVVSMSRRKLEDRIQKLKDAIARNE